MTPINLWMITEYFVKSSHVNFIIKYALCATYSTDEISTVQPQKREEALRVPAPAIKRTENNITHKTQIVVQDCTSGQPVNQSIWKCLCLFSVCCYRSPLSIPLSVV